MNHTAGDNVQDLFFGADHVTYESTTPQSVISLIKVNDGHWGRRQDLDMTS